MRFLSTNLEDKMLVWFEENNRYAMMEQPAYDVFVRLFGEPGNGPVDQWFAEKYNLPISEAKVFIDEVHQLVNTANQPKPNTTIPGKPDDPTLQPVSEMYSSRQYRFSGTTIIFEYGDKKIESMIHPLMAHLEIPLEDNADKAYSMYQKNNQIFLFEGSELLGQWTTEESHFFKGKLFLHCLNTAYHREEHDWLAMLHASAVSDGKSALLFAGNSGDGKSTALSVLLGSGLKYITDDFVPLDAAQRFIFPFPVAISVKQGAFGTVEEIFPELKEIPASAFKTKGESIKYLPPPKGDQDISDGKPVKGIVFIEYKPGVKVELKEISKTDAFHRLVTESWVSPDYKNVALFFNWFKEMPCYKLSYSDNYAMVQKVRELLQDAT